MPVVLLSELVRTSETVAEAPGRRVKIDELAGLLRRAAPDEVPVAVAFLSGELRQRQIGVGYAAVGGLLGTAPGTVAEAAQAACPGAGPALTLAGTDAAFAAIGAVTGQEPRPSGGGCSREVFAQATEAERSFLTRLLAGELHQGALEGVMTEAVARAAGVSAGQVRRAHLLGGSLPAVAEAALTAARDGGPAAASAALHAFRLQVGRPLRPMLAGSAPTVAAAFGRLSPAAVEWKIDGIRIQVHRQGGEVTVFTRTLDDITARRARDHRGGARAARPSPWCSTGKPSRSMPRAAPTVPGHGQPGRHRRARRTSSARTSR